jgi:hypothetical protein
MERRQEKADSLIRCCGRLYPNLRYEHSFTEVGRWFEIVDQRIENENPDGVKLHLYFQMLVDAVNVLPKQSWCEKGEVKEKS